MSLKYPELTEDTLYKMYWVEGKSCPTIGKEIGCGHSTVARYMKNFGVRTRSLLESKTKPYLLEETRKKISRGLIGRQCSEETRKKISRANTGRYPSKETRRKLSEARKGKHPSEETRRKLSEATKGEKHYLYGKHPSKETRKKMGLARTGERNSSWKGGVSYEPYCHKFNDQLKEEIRKKYGRKCFLCGKSENQNGVRLSIHHVDGDKTQGCNGKQWMLIPLCVSCHTKVHQDKRVNDALLFKLNAEGYARSCQQPHNASLNDYIFTPGGEEEGIFLEAIEI